MVPLIPFTKGVSLPCFVRSETKEGRCLVYLPGLYLESWTSLLSVLPPVASTLNTCWWSLCCLGFCCLHVQFSSVSSRDGSIHGLNKFVDGRLRLWLSLLCFFTPLLGEEMFSRIYKGCCGAVRVLLRTLSPVG